MNDKQKDNIILFSIIFVGILLFIGLSWYKHKSLTFISILNDCGIIIFGYIMILFIPFMIFLIGEENSGKYEND